MAEQWTQNFRYPNESYSGCDITAAITVQKEVFNSSTNKYDKRSYTEILGSISTLTYSVNMDKHPVRSIGNVNAKDYTIGQRTIAGTLIFAVFNKHFSQDIIKYFNSTNTGGTLYLVDEIPPFDITISLANEYGYRSRIVIYGVRLVNEGMVMSINDVYLENTYQFYATGLEYLTDEISYSRSNSGDLRFRLTDTIDYLPYVTNKISAPDLLYDIDNKAQKYWDERYKKGIKLSISVSQPKFGEPRGSVTFVVDPNNLSGELIIHDSENKVTRMISSNSMFIRSFYPDTYTAYFSDGTRKSNTVKFTIYENNKPLNNTYPIISNVSSNTLLIEGNNQPIKTIYVNNNLLVEGEYDDYIIDNLEPNNKYLIKVNNKPITIRTKALEEDKKILKETIKYNPIYDTDYTEFENIIDNLEPDININKALRLRKQEIERELKELDTTLNDYYELSNKLIKTINQIAILIFTETKLINNFNTTINKNNAIKPEIIFDENYNFIFNFDSSIISASIYSVDINDRERLITTINREEFNNNQYRFIGKPKQLYYIQAEDKYSKSQKVYFYNMSEDEKKYFINKDYYLVDKNTDVIEIDSDIKNVDFDKAKALILMQIDDELLFPPKVEFINDTTITVNCYFNSLIHHDLFNNYYIVVSDYQSIKSGKVLFKFNYYDDLNIYSEYIDYKKDTDYFIWIEDNTGKQISNISGFTYGSTDYTFTEYEVKKYTDIFSSNINRYADDIYATINECTDINKLLPLIINTLNNKTISKDDLLSYLYSIKHYIGLFKDSTDIIKDVEFNNNILKFSSDIIRNFNVYHEDYINIGLTEEQTIIDINQYSGNLIIITVNSNDLTEKSDIIVINKKERWCEII